MKNLIAFLFVMLVTFSFSFAQLTNLQVADSSITIDRVYAGVFTGPSFYLDNIRETNSFTNVRLGAMATYTPAQWISFRSWGMVQVGGPAFDLEQFWLKLKPINNLTIECGYMATLVTEQRPHPISGDGQFETWAESTIPGMAVNIKVKYNLTKDLQIASGMAYRNDLPEYSGRVIYKKIQLSGWYSSWNKKVGGALTFNTEKIYSCLVFKEQILANCLSIKLMQKENISFYTDCGYSFDDKKMTRVEAGLLKNFESRLINGLIGLGYCKETKSLNGYFLIYL